MSSIPGTNVASMVVPITESDIYATHDAKYGKGGYRSVSTITARNAIPYPRREIGMMVCIIEGGNIYKLISNPNSNVTENSDWVGINDISDIIDINTTILDLYHGELYKSANLETCTVNLNSSNIYSYIKWCVTITDTLPNISFSNTILWRYDNDLELVLNSFNIFEFETWDSGVTWLAKTNRYYIGTPEQHIDKADVDLEISAALQWETL